MWWENVIGQKKIIKQLKSSIELVRVPHAQMFIGDSGFGSLALAIAFAWEILYSENPNNRSKLEKFMHSDLHFFFPTIKDDQYEINSKSSLSEWKKFIQKNPYSSLNDWYNYIKIDNKQGIISVKEIETILSKISLKSVERGSKIIILWMIEKMHDSAASKFLKLLEEPPENTYFILITEREFKILPTILSRCQITKIPPINSEEIYEQLIKISKYNEEKIRSLIHKSCGNWNKILKLINENNENETFEKYIIEWTRCAFKAKKNPKALKDLNDLSLILSRMGREQQKKFLNYSLEIFRQALMNNYSIDSLVYLQLSTNNFNWKIFSQYIHGGNISSILEELSKAIYYIEQNANSKILFFNILISLTRFLHQTDKL